MKNVHDSLHCLLEGNRRYSQGTPAHPRSGPERRGEVCRGQEPFAMILSCSDSRVPPEIIFDCGLGDLFVVRTAGHTLDRVTLGSLEFGLLELRIPLLMVLGHSACGAVCAAVRAWQGKHDRLGCDIDAVTGQIIPAIERARDTSRGDLVTETILAHIAGTIETLRNSRHISAAEQRGSVTVVGAFYDLSSGKVEPIP